MVLPASCAPTGRHFTLPLCRLVLPNVALPFPAHIIDVTSTFPPLLLLPVRNLTAAAVLLKAICLAPPPPCAV